MIIGKRWGTSTTPQTVDVWKQERIIIEFRDDGDDPVEGGEVTMWKQVGGERIVIAQYSFGAYEWQRIDVTDYVRTYGNSQIRFSYGDNYKLYLDINVVGLISPVRTIIPSCPLKELFLADMSSSEGKGLVVPPSKIIVPDWRSVTVPWWGFPARDSQLSDVERVAVFYKNGSVSLFRMGDVKRADIYENASYLLYWPYLEDEPEYSRKVQLEERACGVNYVLVEWISFWGAAKRFMFELTKHKIASVDNFSLLDILQDYHPAKGREESFTLRLDGLSVYDLWYYSDILTSGQVRVHIKTVTEGTDGKTVEIVGKNIVLPDGENNNGVLEIECKFAKYDALAL